MTKLIDKLPTVQGQYFENAPLSHLTRLGVGGPAEVLFIPKDRNDIRTFLMNCPKDIPLTFLGLGSNVLIRDGGVKGVVILPMNSKKVMIDDSSYEITAEGFVSSPSIAMKTISSWIGGLEFLSCIPGTIGGAVKMNAGCYGGEIKDILIDIEVVDREGNIKRMKVEDCGLGYRTSTIPNDVIITEVRLKGFKGRGGEIERKIRELKDLKKESQPLMEKTAGSAFKNPYNPYKYPAWKLIVESGASDLTVGGAKLSDIHKNFICNSGTATAKDIEDLGDEIAKKVLEKFKVKMEWEIKIIGEKK